MEGIDSNEFTERVTKSFEGYINELHLGEEDLTSSLLDVGAGSGHFIRYVRTVFDNNQAYAVEYEEEKKFSNEDDWLIIADAQQLPFPDSKFKTVVSKNMVPMFMNEDNEFISVVLELLRVTEPGGKIIFDIRTEKSEQESLDSFLKNNEFKSEEDFRLLEEFRNSTISGIEISKRFLQWIEQTKHQGIFKDYKIEGRVVTLSK